MATIADVAKQAGVSMMTVSRVINKSGAVSDATREKVEQAIKQLGYRPNMVARSLATNHSRMVAYVVSDLSNPYFTEVSKGIHSQCLEHDYLVVISDVSDLWRVDDLLEMLVDQRIAGVIFHHLNISQSQVAMLLHKGVKCVTIDNECELSGITTIESDNYLGARCATRYLIEKGHTRIGCIHGHYSADLPKNLEDIEYTESFQRRIWRDRTQGFLDEMRSAGLSPVCMIEGRGSAHYSIVNSSLSLTRMMEEGEMPTALYCQNDLMALGVLGECMEKGIHVPERMAIVGHDGLDSSIVLYPRITTVRQPRYETGYLAAQKLFDAIENRCPPEQITTHSDLFVGNTV